MENKSGYVIVSTEKRTHVPLLEKYLVALLKHYRNDDKNTIFIIRNRKKKYANLF